jgi:error-prone DNA polymerase
VLVRQRPGKGNAIFITLEDDGGVANIILWASQFEALRRPVMTARVMLVEGVLERSKEGVTHIVAQNVIDRSELLGRLSELDTPRPTLSRADVFAHPQPPRYPGMQADRARHPRNARLLPRSRDFH